MPLRLAGVTLASLALLTACGGTMPPNLGVRTGGRLAPCPTSDNCVSSDATTAQHRIDPFRLNGEAEEVWSRVRAAVEALPRTSLVSSDTGYLHAACKSRIFRFIDDLELHLRADEGIIAVRSASRVGRSDLGVNRRRVEELRQTLTEAGLLGRE